MSQNRSGRSVIRSGIEVKSWQQRTPTVDEARPSACPCCKAASWPVGGRVQLQGHGLRDRQVCGPPDPEGAARVLVLAGRRYRCLGCKAILLVVAREVLPRRQYSASAIAFALALWGLLQATARAVRRRVSPAKVVGFTAMSGWATLRRWAKAVRQRDLFPSTPLAGPSTPLREVAALAARALAASAGPATRPLSLEQRAYFGAAHAA